MLIKIRDDDPMYFYKDYRIVKDSITNKWGIKNTKTDKIIIKCNFDNIKWLKEEDLIEFTLNQKYALCKISDMSSLTMV